MRDREAALEMPGFPLDPDSDPDTFLGPDSDPYTFLESDDDSDTYQEYVLSSESNAEARD